MGAFDVEACGAPCGPLNANASIRTSASVSMNDTQAVRMYAVNAETGEMSTAGNLTCSGVTLASVSPSAEATLNLRAFDDDGT